MISVQAQYVYNREKFMKRGGFINFPFAWNSDAATAYMMSDGGVLSTPSIVFTFRKSSIHITGDGSIKNRIVKLTADYLYWGWVHTFVSQLSVKNYKTKFLRMSLIINCKFNLIFYCLESLFQNYQYGEILFSNKYLSRSRKIKIFLHAVFCQITHS